MRFVKAFNYPVRYGLRSDSNVYFKLGTVDTNEYINLTLGKTEDDPRRTLATLVPEEAKDLRDALLEAYPLPVPTDNNLAVETSEPRNRNNVYKTFDVQRNEVTGEHTQEVLLASNDVRSFLNMYFHNVKGGQDLISLEVESVKRLRDELNDLYPPAT